ncbi:hypothetical protein CDD81_7564 [Ophiocordyceps australis]|uniref:Uncharacterized protein n=1 Tax=Ophiocordyceps australis TaxID=1399860 RepID=A0A2C5Y3A4_9HYPO|nr:hypothetical protein CDD81_7564 [Ophiocordyceps australis]
MLRHLYACARGSPAGRYACPECGREQRLGSGDACAARPAGASHASQKCRRVMAGVRGMLTSFSGRARSGSGEEEEEEDEMSSLGGVADNHGLGCVELEGGERVHEMGDAGNDLHEMEDSSLAMDAPVGQEPAAPFEACRRGGVLLDSPAEAQWPSQSLPSFNQTAMQDLLADPWQPQQQVLSYPPSGAMQAMLALSKPMLTVDTYSGNANANNLLDMWDGSSASTALNSGLPRSIVTGGSAPTSTQTSPQEGCPSNMDMDWQAQPFDKCLVDNSLVASGKPQQDFVELIKPWDQDMAPDYADAFPPQLDGSFTFPILTPELQPALVSTPELQPLVVALLDQAGSASHELRDMLDKIKMHIQESMLGIGLAMGPWAHQLSSMSAETVVAMGLEAMATVLERRPERRALNLICLFHLLYSLAMVLEGPSVPRRQYLHEGALRFANNLPNDQNRQAFISMADLFWKARSCHQSPGLRRADAVHSIVHSTINMFHMDQVALPLETLALAVESLLDDAQETVMRDTASLLPLLPSGVTELQLRRDSSACASWLEMTGAIESAIVGIKRCFPEASGLHQALQRTVDKVNMSAARVLPTPHSLELELMQIGKMHLPRTNRLVDYIREVRQQLEPIYWLSGSQVSSINLRLQCHEGIVQLLKDVLQPAVSEHNVLHQTLLVAEPPGWNLAPTSRTENIVESHLTVSGQTSAMVKGRKRMSRSRSNWRRSDADKVEYGDRCKQCSYRPSGNPAHHSGSMRKHVKNMHRDGPDVKYPCDEPGCNKVYTNRRDNLLQHKAKIHNKSRVPQRRRGQRGRCESEGVFE